MCLGSVSSPYNTLVVDTLFNNRDYARSWMTKMLTGKRTLKVFLGVNNDVFRLRKEWNVFPYGVVDIHSMFLQWKESNIMGVYEQCLPTVKNRDFLEAKTIRMWRVSCTLTSFVIPDWISLLKLCSLTREYLRIL